MTGVYAAKTDVGSDRSRAEIERTLTRYGHHIDIHQGACWEWTGPKDDHGYGVASTGRQSAGRAHRVIYEAFRGPVDPALDLDHRCHTSLCPGGDTCPHRACVRPDHLRPTPRRQNVLRGSHPTVLAHLRNECVAGHEMTPENTYVSPKGQRHCRACRKRREEERVRDRQPPALLPGGSR